jgi:hypothetical protein
MAPSMQLTPGPLPLVKQPSQNVHQPCLPLTLSSPSVVDRCSPLLADGSAERGESVVIFQLSYT